jgi:mRNA-degrading endonuclease toxin of MazEF toxin-antitoxin module
MGFDRGDVVLVPFPFTDLTTQKQRPGLVISSKSFNDSSPDAILLAITSQVPAELQDADYRLSVDEQQKGGLPKPSVVKAAKVVTLSQALIRKTLGRLPVETVDQIVRKLVSVIG